MKFKNEDASEASEASIRVPQFGVKIQSLKNCKPSILSIITIHSLLNHFLSLV